MIYEELLLELKKHDFKYEPYIFLAIDDENIREKLIKNITEENHINIYYNSYYLVYEASKIKPKLFYQYWDSLVPLLDHKNSYHRSIAHWILTNLIKVDNNNKFNLIKDRYFSMIKDEKFQTGYMVLKDIIIMSDYRVDLKSEIIELFLNENMLKGYKENQIARMQYEIISFFSEINCDANTKTKIINYIKMCQNSNSNKTRRKAKDTLKVFIEF